MTVLQNQKITIIVSFFLFATIFLSCSKGADNNTYTIQQGQDTVQIEWMNGTSGFMTRQNKVLSTPIDLKVQVTYNDSTRKVLSFQIPANYNGWIPYGLTTYVVQWNYQTGYQDSTANTITNPQYKKYLDNYAYLKIVGVSTSDKSVGFQIIRYDDEWHYTAPNETFTTIALNGNNIAMFYKKYDFENNGFIYLKDYNVYYLNFNSLFQLGNVFGNYPLHVDEIIPLTDIGFSWENNRYGTLATDPEIVKTRKNTVSMRITAIRKQYFDATFSGKIWYEGHIGDSTIITNGQITNMKFSEQ